MGFCEKTKLLSTSEVITKIFTSRIGNLESWNPYLALAMPGIQNPNSWISVCALDRNA